MSAISQFNFDFALDATHTIVAVSRKVTDLVAENEDKEIFLYWGNDDSMTVENEHANDQISGWTVSRAPFLSALPGASFGQLVNVFMASSNGWLYLVDTKGVYLEPLLTYFVGMQDFKDTPLMKMELPQAVMQTLVADMSRCSQRVYCRLFRRVTDIVDMVSR